MYLPDDEVRAVSALVDFLYRGWIPKAIDTSRWPQIAHDLIALYILAEKICMPELMDRAMDELSSTCCRSKTRLGDYYISQIYQNTHEKSKIRAYCVSGFACTMAVKNNIDDAWCDRYAQLSETCPEFFVDIFRFQAKHFKTLATSPYKKGLELLASIAGTCTFHTHEKDEDCYLKGSRD